MKIALKTVKKYGVNGRKEKNSCSTIKINNGNDKKSGDFIKKIKYID